jgi:hypothetical protein
VNEPSDKNSEEVLKKLLSESQTIWVKRCENCEEKDQDRFWTGAFLVIGGVVLGMIIGAASASTSNRSSRRDWLDNVIVLDPLPADQPTPIV